MEDNEMNQLVATNILRLWKCNYKVADNGKKALELFEKEDFDIILMDLSMPVMDGFEASKEIRLNFPENKKRYPDTRFHSLGDGRIERKSICRRDERLYYQTRKTV